MGQEDHLKRQIDQLARALAKLLLKLMNAPVYEQNVLEETVSKTLKTEMDLDLSDLVSIPEEKIIATLQTRGLSNNHFTTLSEILYHVVVQPDISIELKASLSRRILLIFDYLNEHSSTYSLAIEYRSEALKKTLKSL
jgi:hypothetical protein